MASSEPPDHDPYWKLRPAPPTPDAEVCHCRELTGLILCDKLAHNPLYCDECNGEVFPERIGFDEKFAEAIAHWQSLHRSLFLLWLDSGDYEQWAAEQLADPHGRVNVVGRGLARRLGEKIPTLYWWFVDVGADDYIPAVNCPVCGGAVPRDSDAVVVCETCGIVF